MFDFLTNPVFVAAMLAFMAALRIVGELLVKLGNLREGQDWMDKWGGKVLEGVAFVGKVLAWLGIGNSSNGDV